MKTKISFLFFTLVTFISYGQTSTTEIKTPLGSTVLDTYYLGELLNSTDKARLSDSIRLRYPNASEVNPPSATSTYNCHSFAWYRSEGGSKNVWIGYLGTTAEDVYWLDGSYIEINGISDGAKVSYLGNHSAIVLSGATCRSKWGTWPLVDHPLYYGPSIYNMTSQKKYYMPLKVNGPAILCSTGSYITPPYVNCTYSWTYDGNKLNYVSGQGTKNIQLSSKTPLVSGLAWLKLTLTINSPVNKTREITKYVWVGTPIISSISGATSLSPNQSETYTAQYPSECGPTSFSWQVSPQSGASLSPNGRYAGIYFSQAGSYQVSVRAQNACGWGTYATTYVEVTRGGQSLSIMPNPTNGNAEISIGNVAIPRGGWSLDIYAPTSGIQTQYCGLTTNTVTVSTTGWLEGIYPVRAIVGTTVLNGKLVVRR